MKEYRNRIVDNILKRKLAGKGAVLIEGPKWCGKTTTARHQSKSVLLMDNPAEKNQNIRLAEMDPAILLAGDNPRLIDEWQLAPKIWDAVRYEVDQRGEPGQFILTGSAVPPDTKDISHSGTGRFSWLTMRPMSLFESGESNGTVSIRDLFAGKKASGISNIDINKLAFLICRGGWPGSIFFDDDIALDQAKDYFDAVVRYDISRTDNIQRNPERVKLLMRSYARNQGSQATIGTIAADMSTNDSQSDTKTISSYISALKKIFVVEDSPAWNPNLRSKSAIRTADTRYFVDPSIGTAAMGLGPNDLINDLNTMGLMFETLCIRDLRVYADALDGQIYHFRDRNGLECDAVIHLRNGSYGLIEIKLGGDSLIEEGAQTLKTLASKIDTDKMKQPSFMMVLTGVGKYAYMRDDNVMVVPIGCLKD
ncbi:MAG: DUF4143 domain-containing protein [Bacteroidales bacterium]|nr:DUF4143 domain-containing protein [Bacteroidales bacterium]